VIDLDSGQPLRVAGIGAETGDRFEIGSITKGLTGMLLADAIDRGDATLRSTVVDLVAEVAGTPLADVSLLELATHTSGLPRMISGSL
jgi:CubicO group peptidase (beta-lactamase class C family)